MQENTTPQKKKMSIWLKIILGFFGVIFILGWIGSLSDPQPKTTSADVEPVIEANETKMEAPEPAIEVNEVTEEAKTDEEDPYYMMHIAFEGMPEIEDFKPQLDVVMERYGMEINRGNLLKVANALVVMRKESKVGVTEAEILKHVYQKGTSKITIAEQIGLSATILETNK